MLTMAAEEDNMGSLIGLNDINNEDYQIRIDELSKKHTGIYYVPFDYLQLISYDGMSVTGQIYVQNENNYPILFRVLSPGNKKINVVPKYGSIEPTKSVSVKVTITPSVKITDLDFFKRNYQILVQTMSVDGPPISSPEKMFESNIYLNEQVKLWQNKLKKKPRFPEPAKLCDYFPRQNITNSDWKNNEEDNIEIIDKNNEIRYKPVNLISAIKPKINSNLISKKLPKPEVNVPMMLSKSYQNDSKVTMSSMQVSGLSDVSHSESMRSTASKNLLNIPPKKVNVTQSKSQTQLNSKSKSKLRSSAEPRLKKDKLKDITRSIDKKNSKSKPEIHYIKPTNEKEETFISTIEKQETLNNTITNTKKNKTITDTTQLKDVRRVNKRNKRVPKKFVCTRPIPMEMRRLLTYTRSDHVIRIISDIEDSKSTIHPPKFKKREKSPKIRKSTSNRMEEILIDLVNNRDNIKSLVNDENSKKRPFSSPKCNSVSDSLSHRTHERSSSQSFFDKGDESRIKPFKVITTIRCRQNNNNKRPIGFGSINIMSEEPDSMTMNTTIPDLQDNIVDTKKIARRIKNLQRGYKYLMETAHRNPFSTNPITMTRDYQFTPSGICHNEKCNIFDFECQYLHKNPILEGHKTKNTFTKDGYTTTKDLASI